MSVVIATYNRRATLARTLAGVFAQDFPPGRYEVIVVVDGSTDGTLEMLRQLHPPCALRVLEQPNLGPSAARNAGIRAARGELVFFLDDDILCDPSLFRRHAAAHDGLEPRFVFGPVLLSPESPATLATDWTAESVDEWVADISRDLQPRWPLHAAVEPNSSVPRAALLACGGYDETFPHQREDADLGFRLWKSGVRFHYLPDAVAHQIFVKSTRDIVRKDAPEYGRNDLLLSRKFPEYRPHAVLSRMAEGGLRKRLARRISAALPCSPEPLFYAALWPAEKLRRVRSMRRAGVRLIRFQEGIETYRSAAREAGSWRALRHEFGLRVPVLMYHHVGPPRAGLYPGVSVTPQKFETHLQWLARHGYSAVRPSDWLGWVRQGKPLGERPVLLTFDDAYADTAAHALPLLKRYGFSGAVFVVTGQIAGTNVWDQALGYAPLPLMSAEQIRHWSREGIEFGAHSRTHADLTKLGEEALREEVAGSAQDLAGLLGIRVASFAYPYGYADEKVVELVRAHFDLAFSCEEGLNTLRTDPLVLRRVSISQEQPLPEFAWRVRFGRVPIPHLRERLQLRTRAKRLGRWFLKPFVHRPAQRGKV